jgi:hypothetical protein
MKSVMTVGQSKISLVCLLAAATVSCSRLATKSPPLGQPLDHLSAVSDPESTIERLVSERTYLLFRSRSGRRYGMDSDSDIVLRTNHYAALTEYGYGVMRYIGSFRVDPEGNLLLSLADYRRPWPAMRLVTRNNEFYLQTASGRTGFIMGDRAGAFTDASMAPFWPFKLIQARASDVERH